MKTLIVFSGLLLLISCKKEFENCFRSTGEIQVESRKIASFKNLQVEDNLSVTWHESDSEYVKITAGKNLIPQIKTENQGNTLFIRNKNSCNWTRSYSSPFEIDLYSHSPYLIRHEGFGVIHCSDTLKASPLTLQHYGAGDLNLLIKVDELFVDFNSPGECVILGQAEKGAYNIQHFGKVRANGLAIKQCEFKMEGENDAWVWVVNRILGEHLSGRTLFLKGTPNQEISLKSSGKIIAIP